MRFPSKAKPTIAPRRWALAVCALLLCAFLGAGALSACESDDAGAQANIAVSASSPAVSPSTQVEQAASGDSIADDSASAGSAAPKDGIAEGSLPAEGSAAAESNGASDAPQPAAVPAAFSEAPAPDAFSVPAYEGAPSVIVNGNVPFFTQDDAALASSKAGVELFEQFSPLDGLGRCGSALAIVGQDSMPQEERDSIGMVKPSGWHTVRYDWIDGAYLYNRCHLIGYQLTGQNANERNLITGTRSMNVSGMQPYENQTASFAIETGRHVLYRVTPYFAEGNLVASGVLMEARSIEDGGAGLQFCVWCYNVEPGVSIDYATGDSWADETPVQAPDTEATGEEAVPAAAPGDDAAAAASDPADPGETHTYVLNTNTHKFHYPSCDSVSKMKEKNKQYFDGTREEAIQQGYTPCGNCNP